MSGQVNYRGNFAAQKQVKILQIKIPETTADIVVSGAAS